MKVDWKETFHYYTDLINFPNSNTKDICAWYQNTCRFYPEDIKLKKSTLIETFIKSLKKHGKSK